MNSTTLSCILDVKDLSFAYPGQPALAAGWSACIGGGVTLLYGDTGSGKSTLLRLLAGSMPGKGQLILSGARLESEPEAYRRHVFFCDPTTDTFDQVTAVQCTASLKAGDSSFDEAKWQGLVEGFALTAHLDKPMYMLSTGSKRKVWLAAALASERALTLLDEPAAALDAASVRFLWRSLAELAERPDRAIVVASAERIDSVPLVGLMELPLR